MAKFKIGDRVRAIGEVDGINLAGKTGRVIRVDGKIFQLCVEFDESIPYGHNADSRGKNGHCRWGREHEFELIENKKIVITTDGKETLARLYEGNKVVKKAEAKCSPDDKFNFNVGAKLAFDRLMENGEKKADGDDGKKWRVVNRKAKVGDYIRLRGKSYSFNKKGDILRADEVSPSGVVGVRGSNHPRNTNDGNFLWNYAPCEYEVVEPIKAETKYYNGKVVCVKADRGYAYTVGKVYEFKDGKVKIDNGVFIPASKARIKTLDEWNEDKGLHCEFIPLVE
jgi:hypothetical protein